jgi:hypothetical protein
MVLLFAHSTLPLTLLVVVHVLGAPAYNALADLAIRLYLEHSFVEMAFEDEFVKVRPGWWQAIGYQSFQSLDRTYIGEDTRLCLNSNDERSQLALGWEIVCAHSVS